MLVYQRDPEGRFTGWWLTYPSENMRSSVGMMKFPIYGKIWKNKSHVPTTNQIYKGSIRKQWWSWWLVMWLSFHMADMADFWAFKSDLLEPIFNIYGTQPLQHNKCFPKTLWAITTTLSHLVPSHYTSWLIGFPCGLVHNPEQSPLTR